MTAGAWIFMLASWSFVLGLTSWSFWRLARTERHFDPDGIRPASAPVPGLAETNKPAAPAARS